MSTFQTWSLASLAVVSGLAVARATSPDDAAGRTFASGVQRVALVELYTSEGCSSCPPAEAWLSQFKKDPELWRSVVPITFHVDYWDHLGWKDPFASPAFTTRQSQYAARWNNGSVYTPGFVLNGHEWHPGSGALAPTAMPKAKAGVLTVTLSKDYLNAVVAYQPENSLDAAREIHLSWLASDLRKAVKSGENSGRELTHDFVSLGVMNAPLAKDAGAAAYRATLALPPVPGVARSSTTRLAVAVWVTATGALESEQAAGGWLP